MHTTFVSATILLLLVTDPLGNVPIFVAALKGVPLVAHVSIETYWPAPVPPGLLRQ